MTPEQAAHEARRGISIAGRFMLDPETHAHGHALGFEGMDFYVAGRGGVLGDPPADVVVATFVFFPRDVVCDAWNRSRAVMSGFAAANEWAGCAHRWARSHLGDDVDWSRLAQLLGQVVVDAPVVGAPLFAGWRALEEPDGDKELALHRMNGLRELRGALHGAAILTVGLTSVEAITVNAPEMLTVFGHTDEAPDPAPLKDRWQLAEARTDRMMGRSLAALESTEREELVALLGQVAT
jgi:hypothetical protein